MGKTKIDKGNCKRSMEIKYEAHESLKLRFHEFFIFL